MGQQHWSFFRHGDTSFGMFYPRGYTLVAFPRMEQALAAEKSLREAGVPGSEVRAVSGDFVAGRLQTAEGRSGFERFKAKIAEALGTEEIFAEQDLEYANQGGAFLFVHTPDDESTERAMALLDEHHPDHARRYRGMAIERLYENGRKVETRTDLESR